MTVATPLLLAVSLSMDSFAAALARGAILRCPPLSEALRVGLAFGICQALMPLAGWGVGQSARETAEALDLLRNLDHWIAFGLLLLVGGSMIRAGWQGTAEAAPPESAVQVAPGDEVRPRLRWLALVTTAIATSIDAGAVGIGLAVVEIDIVVTVMIVGVVTFAFGVAGVLLGHRTSSRLGGQAETIGGLGLIAIGIHVLVEHTMP